VRTLKPGRVPGPDGTPQAPHVAVSVFARGLLHRVVTRIYFADEAEANAADPILSGVPEGRRATLLATPDERGYRFDIRLQGDDETVFFAV
jgi:protocatechuate 3,4-dioxygenase, alpha subunit